MARTILRATDEWQKIISPSDKPVYMCNLCGTSILIYPCKEELYSTTVQIKHPYTIGGTIYQLKSKADEYVYAKAIPVDGVEDTVFPIVTSDIPIPALGMEELREDVNILTQELGRALLRITNEEIKTIEHHEIFKRFQREFMDNEIKTDTTIAKLYNNIYTLNSNLFKLKFWAESHKRLHHGIDPFITDLKDIATNKADIEYLEKQLFAYWTQLNILIGKMSKVEPELAAVQEHFLKSDMEKDRLITNLTTQMFRLNIRLFGVQAFLEEHKRLHQGIDPYLDHFLMVEEHEEELANINSKISFLDTEITHILERINKNGGVENVVEYLMNDSVKQFLFNTNITNQLLTIRSSLLHTQEIVEKHRRNHGVIDAYVDDFAKISKLDENVNYMKSIITVLQNTDNMIVNKIQDLSKLEPAINEVISDVDKQKVVSARITDQLLLVRNRLLKAQIFLEEHKRLHQGIDLFYDDLVKIQILEQNIDYINKAITSLRVEGTNITDRLNKVESYSSTIDRLITDVDDRKVVEARLTDQLMLTRNKLLKVQIYIEEHKRTHQYNDLFLEDIIKIQDIEESINTINVALNQTNVEVGNIKGRLAGVDDVGDTIQGLIEDSNKQKVVDARTEDQLLLLRNKLLKVQIFLEEHKRKHQYSDVYLEDLPEIYELQKDIASINNNIIALSSQQNNIISNLSAIDETNAKVDKLSDNVVKQNVITTGLHNQVLDMNSRLFNAELYILALKRKFPTIEVQLGDVDVTRLDEQVSEAVLNINALTASVNNIINKLNTLDNTFNRTIVSSENSVLNHLASLDTTISSLNNDFDSLNNGMVLMANANSQATIEAAFNTIRDASSEDMTEPLTALENIILRIKSLETTVNS